MAQILEDFFEAQNIFLAEAEAEALLSEPQKLPARPSRSDGRLLLPDFAQKLATDASLAGLMAVHDPFRESSVHDSLQEMTSTSTSPSAN